MSFLSSIGLDFLADLLFPKQCFGCHKSGSYLCLDCLATVEIMESYYCLCPKPRRILSPGKCPFCKKHSLDGLCFAVAYKNSLVKKLIHRFKYPPYVKELKITLTDLIMTHLYLCNKDLTHFILAGQSNPYPTREGSDQILLSVPLDKQKLKNRGFNQARALAETLSNNWQIPLVSDCLIKTKTTKVQAELSALERRENLKNAFACLKPEAIYGKQIFLVDDVYTTGATMDECARILKSAGAKKVWGLAIAREELKS
jgi:ComF family protein